MDDIRKTLRTLWALIFAAGAGGTVYGETDPHNLALAIIAGVIAAALVMGIGEHDDRKRATKAAKAREAEIIAEEHLRARVRAEIAGEPTLAQPAGQPELRVVGSDDPDSTEAHEYWQWRLLPRRILLVCYVVIGVIVLLVIVAAIASMSR
jgi:hypothetical protein